MSTAGQHRDAVNGQEAPVSDPLSRPFMVTFFRDYGAATKHEEAYTLASLANRVRAVTAGEKSRLPWLKLARFGDARSNKNSLRHDGNVLAITGIEADYDGGRMTFDQAVEIATKAGVLALIYTSPSHTEAIPRWRVLCPTSSELPPDRRTALMGRLNGLFQGIFSGESWALSQGYYFGSVNGNPAHRAELVEGEPIDDLDGLDPLWLGKPNTETRAGSDGKPRIGPVDEAALLAEITSGASYHEAAVRLLGKWARDGVAYMDARARLIAAMDAMSPSDRDARWKARRADVDRCLEDIYGKEAKARDEGRRPSPKEQDAAPAPLRTITATELFSTVFPPRELVLGPWLPAKGLAMLYGLRGIGKTHLTLGCAYAIASGGSFLRWHAPRPRRVLILDGEMPAVVLQERMAAIVAAAGAEPPEPDFLRVLALDLQERDLDLADEEHQAQLDAVLGEAEVIFVDNISTLARGGRENEAESWLPVQQWALRQRRAGRSVVFVHHAGKGGQQRGTSRREDVLDTVIALRKPADHQPDQGARFELHYEKSRGFHGDDAKPFEAALDGAGWTTRDLADAELARVMALTGDGLSVRDIADELGMSKSAVARVQKRGRALGMAQDDDE